MKCNLVWNHTRDLKKNRTSAWRSFGLKSQVWFQTKIARYEVQLPLYCTHFEIKVFVNFNIHVSTSGNPVFKKRNRKSCYIDYANDHVMWQYSLVCKRKQFFSHSKLSRGWPDFFSLATSIFLMVWFVIFLLVIRKEAMDFIMVPIVF